jgi:hypothetical protein
MVISMGWFKKDEKMLADLLQKKKDEAKKLKEKNKEKANKEKMSKVRSGKGKT